MNLKKLLIVVIITALVVIFTTPLISKPRAERLDEGDLAITCPDGSVWKRSEAIALPPDFPDEIFIEWACEHGDIFVEDMDGDGKNDVMMLMALKSPAHIGIVFFREGPDESNLAFGFIEVREGKAILLWVAKGTPPNFIKFLKGETRRINKQTQT